MLCKREHDLCCILHPSLLWTAILRILTEIPLRRSFFGPIFEYSETLVVGDLGIYIFGDDGRTEVLSPMLCDS